MTSVLRDAAGRLASLAKTTQFCGDKAQPGPERRGFCWVHLLPYLLFHLACLALSRELQTVPAHVLARGRTGGGKG